MRWVLNKHLVGIVLLLFSGYVLLPDAIAGTVLGGGKKTADEAASFQSGDGSGDGGLVPLRYTVLMGNTYAEPDTTDFEFPGEEESHLIRDISIFLIASAFVGYFIIKVFLEGDTEESEDEDEGNGKPTPL
jgi:hypothetical protein